jgi:signal transduction histidine kinase
MTAETSSIPPATFELPLPPGVASAGKRSRGRREKSLSEAMLVKNVQWFCFLRWFVIALLCAFGAAGMIPSLMERMELVGPGIWPLAAAGILTLANVAFLLHARSPGRPPSARRIKANIWSQIVVDLLVLTAVVHFVGGMHTYAPFTYLFHIVLACVFFSRRASLLVTLISIALLAGVTAMELGGILAPVTIFHHWTPVTRNVAFYGLAFAGGIWLAVWYLASHLSAIVRQRDDELDQTNLLLLKAQEERAQHMLRTTHQLKAPFSAIHANAQLLIKGYCGELPPEAVEVARGILARCNRLSNEIRSMLQLANLSSQSAPSPPLARLDVAAALSWCIGQLRPTAQEKGNVFDEDLQPAFALCVDDHLKMLFDNLLANAVAYSYPGGHIRVRCRPGADGGAAVTISDDGIGIDPAKLPHIFEEYYRTHEAVKHNKESSGLGLAIVREVVQRHHIRLRVESRPGVGTTFELELPPSQENHWDDELAGAVRHAPSPDRG